MPHLKFDLAKLEKLNDPGRFDTLKPEAMWAALGEPAEVSTIVEIGAGTGLFSAKFAELAPGAHVFAADLEPAMLDWMRANRAEVAAGRLTPVLTEEAHVPLADGVADVVVMINVHHELAHPDATYAEAWRLLASSGRLLVVDWDDRETPKGPPRAVRISAEDAAVFLTCAGFVAVRTHEGLPWHWMLTGTRP